MAVISTTEAAKTIGCSDKALPSWLRALGMFVECSRCHGSGKYSFNQTTGDTCFRCNGRRALMPALTRGTVALAASKVASGDMAPHLAQWKAQSAAKRSLAGLVAEGRAIYETIGAAYTAALDAKGGHGGEPVDPSIMAAQTANNGLFYGDWDTASRAHSLSGLQSDVQFGKRSDYVAVAREARQIVAALRGLRMAWLAAAQAA